MGNTLTGAGYSWIGSVPLVDPKTGVATPQFQRYLALALAQVVNPDGTLATPAVTQAQSGLATQAALNTTNGNVGTLQSQAANLSVAGLLLSPGAAGLTQDNIADGTTFKRVTGVGGSQVQSASIANSAVQTTHIQSGATVSQATTYFSQTTLTYGSLVDIGSVSITPNGLIVLVFINLQFYNNSGGTVGTTIDLYRNGTLMTGGSGAKVLEVAGGGRDSFALAVPDSSPGTSSVSYDVKVELTLNNNPVYVSAGSITALNLKV
ncbi:MAG: hypothetical protein ACRD3D_01040 [Terriglobia bacterium]